MRLVAATATAALAAGLALLTPGATAAPTPAKHKPSPAGHGSDVREVKPNAKFSTKKLHLKRGVQASAQPDTEAATDGTSPPVGTVRTLIGLDDFNGILYRKDRGLGRQRHLLAPG